MDNDIIKLVRKFNVITVMYSAGIVIWAASIELYLQSIGYTIAAIMLFNPFFWIFSTLSEIPAGVISDTFGRKKAMLISCILRGFGLGLLFIPSHQLWILLLSGLLTAVSESFNSGTMSAWVIDKVKSIDEKYDIENIFSKNSLFLTSTSMVVGFVGGRILGVKNLSYPLLAGIILFIITIVYISLFFKDNSHQQQDNQPINLFSGFVSSFKEGYAFLRTDKLYFSLCISFLPLILLIVAPSNQWQLYFGNEYGGVKITAYIWVGMGLFGIIGSRIPQLLARVIKNKLSSLQLLLLNMCAIILCVVITNVYLSVLFFLMHVSFTTADAIIRTGLLHNTIPAKSTNRNTLISFFYTIESCMTAVVIIVIGVLTTVINLGTIWIMFALIATVISLPSLRKLNKKIETEAF
ncbi:putative Major facilitator superfamily MFS_1 [Brochothrix thermosphacta]|uniref:MFS transporter n=1 Tax=Brochothrix thermosphacta TaxID=2756 RepID=UPI000D112271|nr:MFS transporter [Brochothrix thermosphacta]SOC31760.1 putative Major facilitator superfamily MFS_1 [Brochothrix thermosphacta]